MKKFVLFLALCSAFASCTTIYYVGETTEQITLYSSPDPLAGISSTIPAKSKVLTKKKSSKYHYLIYKTSTGYAYRPVFTNYHKFNSATDGFVYGYSSSKKMVAPTYYPEGNSGTTSTKYSPRGSDSTISTPSSGGGGRVNVKGYTRKDGTYVRPHTRSAPTRKH